MIQPALPVAEPFKLSQPEAPVVEPAPDQAQHLPSSPTIPLDAPDLAPTPEWPAYPANEPVATPVPQEEPILATNRIEPASNAAARQEGVLMPVFRGDAFLENELETTMKRPAVRLQPMHTSTIKTDHPYPADRGRSADRLAGGKAAESTMSNKERLLKGYQYQLAGAYDEAMQEYRILIRNAPELLGDLISNVRALLRLAPKYTAGYRVLGDAYMRQGEYLQAMEAYNKALTIAKKAKGLSH
jgi:tetratricopeptide (TPR) repeat protein